ncbi:MAG TPA: haloacid dehalogenase [archaeon]|nr:haloacid dehalogenase [archaeon]
MNLKNTFTEISKNLEILYHDREEILRLSRKIVRDCSISIKHIHRKEFIIYQEKIDNVKKVHKQLVECVNRNPGLFFKYLKTPEQEFTESVIFYSIVNKEALPTPSDLKINPINYILGLADVVGELRRFALDSMRNSQVEDLNDILESMDEIYTHLFSLDYPSGLTQDLRHKIDVARNIIEKTRGDVSLAIQMNDLKSCLPDKF